MVMTIMKRKKITSKILLTRQFLNNAIFNIKLLSSQCNNILKGRTDFCKKIQYKMLHL